MNEDRKYEKIGRTVTRITYWFFALKFIICASIPAAVVLFIISKPLWWAPLIGLGAFLIYRFFWRLVFWTLYKLSRIE
ncbi:MAG: hypothetical protein K5761_02820 [Clostridiales bacterium]|nr:hypothetical protein [Clostridiales bacterium]